MCVCVCVCVCVRACVCVCPCVRVQWMPLHLPVHSGGCRHKKASVKGQAVCTISPAAAGAQHAPPVCERARAPHLSLPLFVPQMLKPKKTEVTDKLRQEINKVVNRYIDQGTFLAEARWFGVGEGGFFFAFLNAGPMASAAEPSGESAGEGCGADRCTVCGADRCTVCGADWCTVCGADRCSVCVL